MKLLQRARPLQQNQELDDGDVLSLRAFFALGNSELHFLTFGQRFESSAVDCAEMHKHVRAVLLRDKTKTFGLVEPFNVASAYIGHTKNPVTMKKKQLPEAGRLAVRSAGSVCEEMDEALQEERQIC